MEKSLLMVRKDPCAWLNRRDGVRIRSLGGSGIPNVRVLHMAQLEAVMVDFCHSWEAVDIGNPDILMEGRVGVERSCAALTWNSAVGPRGEAGGGPSESCSLSYADPTSPAIIEPGRVGITASNLSNQEEFRAVGVRIEKPSGRKRWLRGLEGGGTGPLLAQRSSSSRLIQISQAK